MDLSWNDFKDLLIQRKISPQFCKVGKNYLLSANDGFFSASCLIPLEDDHPDTIDFVSNFKEISNKKQFLSVQTEFERSDLEVKIASKKQSVDENGHVEISIRVPGVAGSEDGRYIGGGLFFFDHHDSGDMVKKISVVDVDNILGLGAETTVSTYYDDGVNDSEQGWYIPPVGHASIESMGYYGFIPSGLYLEIYAKKADGITSGTGYTNVFWGKVSK